jgi:hypothetical protein
MQEYGQGCVVGAFDRSRGLFDSMVAELAGPEAGQRTHADLEEWVQGQGRELLRSLFADHLELRAEREPRRTDVVGGDGRARTRTERGHERGLATVFGPVTVTRMAYRAPGAVNAYPADVALSLPVGKHSHGLRRLAAIESVRGSFEDAAAAIGRSTGVAVGKRQVEALALAAATDVAAFYTGRRPGPRPAAELLVMTWDGKGIVMHADALREATAKAAAAGARKLATRLSPGDKRGRKRMAELCAVYDAAPQPRTPADIITPPGGATAAGEATERKRGPAARGKWLTASITHDIPAVVAAGFDEADRRDPGHLRTWVVLVDGNKQQIEAIRAEAARREVTVTIVIDFVHVLEYLWEAAWSFYYQGDPDAEAWVAAHAVKILQGKAGRVAAAIRQKATLGGFSATERKNADTAANYLRPSSPTSTTPTRWTRGWPMPPASSKAPTATWSKTGWRSPVHAGACPAPRPSSPSERSSPTATSTSTGPITSTANTTASTDPATHTTTPSQHDQPGSLQKSRT